MSRTRVRFAPSPTGGLHLGGVRTALYNYLFAKKNDGDFVLRIEDTDQTRYIEGAEQYIVDSLNWCGISPDEGPHKEGGFGPYRQSERKDLYRKYAEQLVASGHAYYAFDTPEQIEDLREKLKAEGNTHIQYDHHTRLGMRNSLSLSREETDGLLASEYPYVIRLKVPRDEIIMFEDIIRGEMRMDTNAVDDKVLLKADGMPTYHLAVVVDDYLMKITHAFRGEEWLPSAPVHILLWKYLGWQNQMPKWAHLPLILKPDGNGKLSKRDGQRLGFPVFPTAWHNAAKNENLIGFKEIGFLPEAFINMLAFLGWSPGGEQEIYSLPQLVKEFDIQRIHASGAKFDFEKAKWFNHEWIKNSDAKYLLPYVAEVLKKYGVAADDKNLIRVIELTKDRCTLLTDFDKQARFFYIAPQTQDFSSIIPKWTSDKTTFFQDFLNDFENLDFEHADQIESKFKELAARKNIKPGELLLPFRIMLVGDKFGPGAFDIASIVGKEETTARINTGLKHLSA